MELVKGVPLTEYCDREASDCERPAATLLVGLPGGPARPPEGNHPPRPQAANVLVAEVDGRPTPKVIDFGVAKATEVTADRA